MTTKNLTTTSFQNRHTQDSYDLTHLPESTFECDVIFEEIFVNNDYGFNQHITLKDDDVVFDIGGNYGFFSVYAATLAKNLSFYIFEPIPDTFSCLQENINRHVLTLGHQAHTYQKAVGKTNSQLELNYYPGFSTLSSIFHQPTNDTMSEAFRTMPKESYGRVEAALKAYNIKLSPEMVWDQAAQQKQVINCDLVPLSDIIRDQNINKIDLLKIDTQGAEVSVIKGICDADWPKISQVALEINMWQGLDSVDFDFFSFFEDKGYDVTMMSSRLTPWNNRLLFATRKKST